MSNGLVYLVDDAEYDRILIGKYLTKSGFECVIFNNGKELIKALEELSTAIVLIDIEMPEMNGIDIAKYLRSKLETPGKHFTLIGITGHCEEDIIKEIASSGFDDCLHKPVSKTELINRINQYLSPADLTDKKPEYPLVSSLYTLDHFDPEDEEFLKSIIQMFIQNTPDSIKQLKLAYEELDWSLLRNIAHKLKPHFQYFGIDPVVKALQEMENIATMQTNTSRLPVLLATIEQISCSALEQLKMRSETAVS